MNSAYHTKLRRWVDTTVILALGAMVVMFIAYVSVPSRLLLQPVSLTITEDAKVVYVRKTHYGGVISVWNDEIYFLDADRRIVNTCISNGRTLRTETPTDTSVWTLYEWFERGCFPRPGTYSYWIEERVVVFGFLQLIPVTFTSEFVVTEEILRAANDARARTSRGTIVGASNGN